MKTPEPSPLADTPDIASLLSEIQILKAMLNEMTHTVAVLSKRLEEKDLRQKVSGGGRTPKGARLFLTVKSYTGTLRKRSRDVWTGLMNAMADVQWKEEEKVSRDV